MPVLLIRSCYHKETCFSEQQLWHLWHRPAGSPTPGSCLCRLAPLWDSACHKSSSTDCAFHAAWTQPLPLPGLHLLSRPAATWEVLEEGAVAGDHQWWRDVNILAKQLIRTTPPWNNLQSPEQRDRGRRLLGAEVIAARRSRPTSRRNLTATPRYFAWLRSVAFIHFQNSSKYDSMAVFFWLTTI